MPSVQIARNIIWDPETLLALCDPQSSNAFSAADVYDSSLPNPYDPNTIFGNLISLRTPGLPTGIGLSQNDMPFLGLATGYTQANTDIQNPNGIGINNTILRSGNDGMNPLRRMFQPRSLANAHPYLQDQLITKLFNNLTTRSNVFAVWVTVGFFEVTDDRTRPVKLGAEIGRSEARHIRHRMFAIVDRSTLDANFGPKPTFDPRLDPALVPYYSIIK